MMTNATRHDSTQPAALTVVATVRARAGHQSQLKEVLTSLIQSTRSDPGMIAYELYQDADDAAQFYFFEVWESVAAYQHHVNRPHVKAFTSRETEFVDGGTLVHRLQPVDRC